jgi:hypothetical protein
MCTSRQLRHYCTVPCLHTALLLLLQAHARHSVKVASSSPLSVCLSAFVLAAAPCRTNFMALWLNGFVMIPSVNIPAEGKDYLQVRHTACCTSGCIQCCV